MMATTCYSLTFLSSNKTLRCRRSPQHVTPQYECQNSQPCILLSIENNHGFGGLVVSMLASGTQDHGFDPGRSRRIFRAKKSTACLPWGGSKAISRVADLRSMSKNPGFTWKSKSQAKLTGHFSPVIPSFADRGLSCRLHVEAPRGESGDI